MFKSDKQLLWVVVGSVLLIGGLGVGAFIWQRRKSAARPKAEEAKEESPSAPQPSTPAGEPEIPPVDLSTVKRYQPRSERAKLELPEEQAAQAETEPSPENAGDDTQDSEREAVEAEPAAQAESDAATDEARGVVSTTAKGLGTSALRTIEALVRVSRPRRLWGREYTPEPGDEAVVVLHTGTDEFEVEDQRVEIVLAQVEGFADGLFDLRVLGSMSRHGIGEQLRLPGISVGYEFTVDPEAIVIVIKPEEEPPTAVKAKNRRKRYPIQAGGRIEVRPKEIPADGQWSPSRDDVAVRVVEQDDSRAVLVLEGPGGDVNLALLSAGNNGTHRPIDSWKFKLAAAEAS